MTGFAEFQKGIAERDAELANWQLIRQWRRRNFHWCFAGVWHWVANVFRGSCRGETLTVRKLDDIGAEESQQERERLAQEYSDGYIAGWRECLETCLQAVEDEITTADDLWRMGAALVGSANIRRDN